jgi:hypothetical protein
MPRANDSGDSGGPSHHGAPDTAFRQPYDVGIAITPFSELTLAAC